MSDEQTPTTEPASKQESGSTSAASSCYAGSRFRNPVPGVTLGAISPEARDLLDTIMDAYREQYNPETHMSSPDDVYQFAYWLCRWSGLIQPLAHRDSAADRLAYACAKAIMRGNVRVRSAIDDALLDYLCVGGPDGPKDVPSWVETFERNQSA